MADEQRSFDELLGAPADSFEPPIPLPVGSYHAMVKEYKKTEKPSKQGNHGIDVVFNILGAMDDVDTEELQKSTQNKPLNKHTVRQTFWMTEAAAHRIRTFLEMLGIDISGRTLREVLPEMKGRPIIVSLRHNPSEKDPSTVYVEVGGFTKEVA